VATSFPRIGVTKDPQLAAALELTRPLLDAGETRSEAGHVRRLALLGAATLQAGSGDARAVIDRQRLLARIGVRPAVQPLDDLPWLEDEPVDEQRRVSRALDWARGHR
jgi:hypothetical protein